MSRHVVLLLTLHCIWFLHRVESNSFVDSPHLATGDVTGSTALEWTLQSVSDVDDVVWFIFNGADVFRYIPYTGVIPPRVLQGPGGNPLSTNATYDPRFTIYNTSARGVGFRLAGLRPEDAGTYTCRYESLSAPITLDADLFVYDIPTTPTIEQTPEDFVEGETNVTLTCTATSTSLLMGNRPTMLYTWSRNGVDIDRTGPPERHTVLGDSGQTLEILPVHHTDITYTCSASENGTLLTSKEREVTLGVLPPSQDFIVIGASAAAGGLVLLIIIIVVAVCCARRRRKKKDVEELVPYATANGPQAFTNGVSNGLNVSVPSHYDIVEGTTAQHPYHVTSGAEDPYTDIASVHDKNKRGQGEGQAPKIPKKVQGITYSEVTFAKDSEARPEVIHSKEPSTQYSKVDFSRKAPPSN